MKNETVSGCDVIELLSQQKISGGGKSSMRTTFRYIVVCTNETFVCESAMLQGKFDNSNIFFRLKKGQTYRFKVCGIGKGFFTDYRNIIEVK